MTSVCFYLKSWPVKAKKIPPLSRTQTETASKGQVTLNMIAPTLSPLSIGVPGQLAMYICLFNATLILFVGSFSSASCYVNTVRSCKLYRCIKSQVDLIRAPPARPSVVHSGTRQSSLAWVVQTKLYGYPTLLWSSLPGPLQFLDCGLIL